MFCLGIGNLSIEEYLDTRLREFGMSQEEIEEFKQALMKQNTSCSIQT